MTDLVKLYQSLKFKHVETYVQSGNIIFDTGERSAVLLSEQIGQKISDTYKFHVPVIIRTLEQLKIIVDSNPFINFQNRDPQKLYVTLLSEIPFGERKVNLSDAGVCSDEYIISENNIFLYCSGRYNDTKYSNTYFENIFKAQATTRNWKTIHKLVEIASEK